MAQLMKTGVEGLDDGLEHRGHAAAVDEVGDACTLFVQRRLRIGLRVGAPGQGVAQLGVLQRRVERGPDE